MSFVVIANSKMNRGQKIFLIKARSKRWRPVGHKEAPQEFSSVEKAQNEIRRATQDLSCEVITKEAFNKLRPARQQTQSHLERLLDRKLRLMDYPVEMDELSYEMTDSEFGASDGGSKEFA